MANQVPRDTRLQVVLNVFTAVSSIRDFTRMIPPTLFGTEMKEDPQGCIDEIFNVLDSMGVSSQEKAELAAYQLKDVAQIWYDQ